MQQAEQQWQHQVQQVEQAQLEHQQELQQLQQQWRQQLSMLERDITSADSDLPLALEVGADPCVSQEELDRLPQVMYRQIVQMVPLPEQRLYIYKCQHECVG